MVNKSCFFLILMGLTLSSCLNDKRNNAVMDTDFVILNESLSDEIDTAESDLLNFNTKFKDHLDYIHDFNPRRCNILIKISIHEGDTLVDFFSYDTVYKNDPEIVPIVGSYKSANGITIQFDDEESLTKGILYETHQSRQKLPIAYYINSLQKPMVLRNGKLVINPPPLECDE